MTEHAPPAPSSEDARPIIPLPAAGPPVGAMLAACAVLAVGLFVFLEGRRHETAPRPRAAGSSLLAISNVAPPLRIPEPPPPPPTAAYAPPPPPPAPRTIIKYVDRPVALPAPPPPPPAPPPTRRSFEPALVIDLTEAPTAGQPADDDTVRATPMRRGSAIVAQGTIVPAVLETPIDSTAPGPVRAITSRDIRGFDGARVLIPKGSRLFGQYGSDVQAGHARVLVTWNRLVRPDGASVRLNSPAADQLGEPGVAGAVNNHVLARFASATLQSALAVGVSLASQPGNGSVIVGQPVQTMANAGQSLIPDADAKPSIFVKQGADISAFVAHDLDFSRVAPWP